MSAVIVESGRPVSLAAVESGRQTCSPTTVDSGRRSRRLACMSVSVQRAEQAPGGETISVLWARRRAPRRGGWRGSDFLVAPPVGGIHEITQRSYVYYPSISFVIRPKFRIRILAKILSILGFLLQ